MNIKRALVELFGLGDESWHAWRALIGGAFGCKLTDAEAATFRELTQRDPLQAQPRELWLAIGRRGGKNYVTAKVVAYLALLVKWRLSPGEVGVALVLASDRAQAKVAYRYILGTFQSDPTLWAEVANVTADAITLANGIEIQVGTSDYASVRGRTVCVCICDEFTFWPAEAALEVLRAVRPGMATQPRAMLIVISSVYSQRGPFFSTQREYFGVENPHVLYALATTRQMNPTITQEFIDAELQRDPASAAAEYLSQARSDLEDFIDRALVERAQRAGPRELPRQQHVPNGTPIYYHAGVDVSGGKRDSTAAAVAYRDGHVIRVAAARVWPAPHDPAAVAAEVAAFLKLYGLASARSDQYGADLRTSIYRDASVSLIDAELTRSELYLHLLPLFTSDRIEIPDDPRLLAELIGLERRTGRTGKDAVDHCAGRHDDLANAVAVAAWCASRAVAHGADAMMTTPSEIDARPPDARAGRVRSEDPRVFDTSDDNRAPEPAGGFLTRGLSSPWRI
jgi:hypothetical protein